MTFSQVFYLTEPRLLNPDEQKSFCAKVYDAVTGISIKCVILDQIIAVRANRQRSLEQGYSYILDGECVRSNISPSCSVDPLKFHLFHLWD
jgi:hypothetical protein